MTAGSITLPILTSTPRPAVLGPVNSGDWLTDTFGRRHDNLRISLTDRCNLRCRYCMPEEVEFLPKSDLLTFEEIAEFVAAAAEMGFSKIRLTGGEPLLRRDVATLVRMIRDIPGIRDLSLTTNALLLADQAQPMRDAGLDRLTVSLDTLDAGTFRIISRRDGLDAVLNGIEAARKAGFAAIKLNAVILRGVNEADIVPLVRYSLERGFQMRFIESMPIGAEAWDRSALVSASDILKVLREQIGELVPQAGDDPHAPAEVFRFSDFDGSIGIIASVTQPFCGQCNRVRLTADGKLRNCLFALDELDVRPFLRPTVDRAAIAQALARSIHAKWAGHLINSDQFIKPSRTMHAIGG